MTNKFWQILKKVSGIKRGIIQTTAVFRFLFPALFIFCFLSQYAGAAFASNLNDSTYQRKKNLRIKNPEGLEFWLCFEKNYKEPKRASQSTELQLELFITGDEDANVVIEIDGIGYKHKVFVAGGTVKNVKIPAEAQVKSDEIVERLALHITADKPISVYGLNRRFQTTDTYLGLPTSVLGTEYRAMCYTVSEGLMPQFAIIATDDNTEVTITPSVPTAQHPPKLPFTVYLKKGDVYQVTAKNEPFSDCDLTGSLIRSNKKIAVFSGHQCAYVTPKIIACNHLVEQVPPIPSWGKHFYIGMMKSRSRYTYRVLANEPNTRVFSDNKLVRILKDGEFFDSTASSDVQITASKPVLVAQYSQGFKNGDSIGDPMMLLISPTQQFLNQYRFATPINGYWKHFINVVTPTKSISTMRLDGEPLDPKLFHTLGISRYSIAYINIPFGSHTIEGGMPFGMYSYGFGYDKDAYDAYGTMGGQSFIEYEPANDTLPPMVDDELSGSNLSLILRDDRVDDSGLKDLTVLEKIGLDISIPAFEEGAPQTKAIIKSSTGGIGRMVIEVRDVALNKSIYTICYTVDSKTSKMTYILSEGNVKSCEPDPGFRFGMFARLSALYHSVDFGSSGNLIAKGKFGNEFGTGGWFGFSVERNINDEYALTGRLMFENFGGTLEAPDTSIGHVRVQDGSLVPFQESSLLTLKGWFLDAALGGEYFLPHNFYLLGGLNFSFTLSRSIEYQRKILQPANYTYLDGSRQRTPDDAQPTLSSINLMRMGVFAGGGFNYPINYRFWAFGEVVYNYFFTNMISDGSWNIHQFSLSLGMKMRF